MPIFLEHVGSVNHDLSGIVAAKEDKHLAVMGAESIWEVSRDRLDIRPGPRDGFFYAPFVAVLLHPRAMYHFDLDQLANVLVEVLHRPV